MSENNNPNVISKRYIVPFALFFLLVIVTTIILTIYIYPFFEGEKQSSSTGTNASSPPYQSFAIPNKLYFADEPVPLEDEIIKIKLDTELLTNAYLHASTMLIMKRAALWFPKIEYVLKENDIPDDFKYLAVAESALLNGISSANARGFWQFMRSTAKDYKLIVNKEIDERYHPIKSAKAACKYLFKAKEKLGSWTLAAAAYNRGLSGIQKALDTQKVDNYYDLKLNNETTRYVFRILAFKLILENPKKYGFAIAKEDFYNFIVTKEYVIDKNIEDVIDFSKSMGITYNTLKILNPWIISRKKITVGKGKNTSEKYTILIPKNLTTSQTQ